MFHGSAAAAAAVAEYTDVFHFLYVVYLDAIVPWLTRARV